MFYKTTLKFGLCWSIWLCACSSSSKLPKLEEHLNIGSSLQASKVDDVYLAGQPSPQDFYLLKDQGFVAIINLRKRFEGDYRADQELVEVLNAGLNYYNIPLPDSLDTINTSALMSIAEAIKKHGADGKVLLHCSSMNRAAIWAGIHLYRDYQISPDEALRNAEKLGLRNIAAKTKLIEYLKLEDRQVVEYDRSHTQE